MKTMTRYGTGFGKMKHGLMAAILLWQGMLLALSAQQASPSSSSASSPAPAPAAPSAPAAASQGQQASTLDTVVVQDVPVDQNILPNAPSSSIYGLDTSLQDTPRTVSQINSDQISSPTIKNSNDFVYYTPGLTVKGGQGDPVQPTIRGGLGQVYINGFLAGLSGNANGPTYSNNAIESVDVAAGPATVVYGPSSLTSGYINYITKQPYFDGFHGYVQADFGSWVSGGSSYPDFRQTIDFGAPIIKDQLAYRVSVQKQEADGYYDNTHDNYNDIYFALSYIPYKDLELDYNVEGKTVDQFFTSGWNRMTQALVNNGTYINGPAIPIIKFSTTVNGYNYYSPVLNANGTIATSGGLPLYQYRTSAAGGVQYIAGPQFTTATPGVPSTTTLKGQVLGYVLNPALTQLTHVYGNQTNTGPGGTGADWEVHQQGKAKYTYNDDLTLIDEFDIDAGDQTENNDAGTSTLNKDLFVENRAHAQLHEEYNLFGLDIDHQSDSGVSFRYENTNNDIKTTPTTNAWGDMLISPEANANLGGAQVYGSNGFVTGGVFGNIPTAWAPRYNTVAYGSFLGTPGSVFQDWDAQTGIFTQHNLKFGDQWGLNVGGRADELYVHVINPITAVGPSIAGATASSLAGEDSSNYLLPAVDSSLTYKPVPWTTTYLTFDYSQAYNGSGPGAYSLTGVSATNPGNLSPENFHSDSLLYEAGAKFEFIPNKLFGSIAGFYQERALYNATTNSSAPMEAHGVDASLRYQPTKNLSFGLNGEWINAHYDNYTWSSAGIYSANGILVDNATLFGSAAATNNGHPGTADYRVPGIPYFNASGFAQYKFDFGLGFTARSWWTSSQPLDISNTVIIPAQYNVDLGVFYEQPVWRAELDVTNVTDARIYDLTAGIIEEAPLALQGTIRYKF